MNSMTKRMTLLVTFVLGAGTLVAQTSAPVKDDLFTGTEIFAKGASDVTEVTMDPDTLGMVGGKDKARASHMVLNVVRTYEYDKPGMYRIEDVDAFRNKLNTGDWHCSVHTRSLKSGESTDVCNKHRADDMVETAIITVEPKELTFIHTIVRRSGSGSSSTSGTSGSTSWSSSGDSMLMMMPDVPMAGMNPAWQAQMAISRAQMAAMMAQMRAEGTLQSAQLSPQIRLQLKRMPSGDELKGMTDRTVDIKPMITDNQQKQTIEPDQQK